MNFAAPFKVFDAAFLNEFQVSNDNLVHPVNSDELRVDTGWPPGRVPGTRHPVRAPAPAVYFS